MKILTGITLPELLIKPEIRLDMYLQEVADKYRVTIWKLKMKEKEPEMVKARVEYCKRCIGFASISSIARKLNKDRSTIYYYLYDYTP